MLKSVKSPGKAAPWVLKKPSYTLQKENTKMEATHMMPRYGSSRYDSHRYTYTIYIYIYTHIFAYLYILHTFVYYILIYIYTCMYTHIPFSSKFQGSWDECCPVAPQKHPRQLKPSFPQAGATNWGEDWGEDLDSKRNFIRVFSSKELVGVFFHIFLKMFTPKIGEMIQFDEHIFQMGGEKPPTREV